MHFLPRGSTLARVAADVLLGDDGGQGPQPDPAPAPDPDPEPAPNLAPEPDPAPKPDPAPDADAPDPVATARAEERQRVADVFASPDVKGREAAAVLLLTETDMAADRIIAKLPGLTPASANDMLARMRAPNPALGAGAETEPTSRQEAGAFWDRVHAKAFTPNSSK
ncbi:MAG: hypothetical protein QOH47_2407 [Sphingomonadales bacterium]|jgi:hypothetical protein|nr:hypothetical protein [Sphingomonadales bacterium]